MKKVLLIRALTVEHHAGSAIHPRAAHITQRTMEVLRTVGIEQEVMRASEGQFDQDGAIMAAETLTGKELAYFFRNINEGVRDVSPCSRLFVTQSLLEPLMKRRATELGAEFQFSTSVTKVEPDASGVTAHLTHRETGEARTVCARYLVACDGPRSPIREALGIPVRGRGVLSKSITIYFRGDLAPLMAGRNLSVILVRNAKLRGFIRIEKPYRSGFLVVNTTGDPAAPNEDIWDGLNDEQCVRYVHEALGANAAITIDNVMRWQAVANTAETYRRGPVFLAGDSAHTMPPYGGFGGNTGMQDAHNLAWKLAAVINGWAGEDLLDTYDRERRPVGLMTTEQGYARYVTREATYRKDNTTPALIDDLEIELGYVYPGFAGSVSGHANPRETRGRPGTRLPHAWLREGFSTLDLFGKESKLLIPAGSAEPAMREVARKAAGGLGVPLESCAIPEQLMREHLGGSDCALVRPDGFVAGRLAAPLSETSLRSALSVMLHRELK